MAQPGYVYVMLEPENVGLVKIGLTRKGSSDHRAKDLFGSGRARPLVAVWEEHVSDPEHVERAMHRRFAAHRVNPRREFFQVAPRLAILGLMEEAAAYRVEPVRSPGRVELLERLRAQFGDIIRPDLLGAAMVVRRDGVLLETTARSAMRDTTTTRSSLDFIYVDGNEALFSADTSAEENAERLLAVDELTLVMTTNLVDPDAAERIDHEQNPYYTGLWLAMDDDAEA